MLHPLPEHSNHIWDGFTNPFRYSPHPLVRMAASEVLSRLETWRKMPEESLERRLEHSFAEGKMLGVLVCKHPDDDAICYLAAFSGTAQGLDGRATSTVEGFVPPIIDLTDPDGYFKVEERKISGINREIAALTASEKLTGLKETYNSLSAQRDSELNILQAEMQFSKRRREEIRSETTDPNILADLIKESQFQKAELKRLKDKWKVQLESLSQEIFHIENAIAILKANRAKMSDDLQRWIFENAVVHNALGESCSIWDLFQNEDLIPPGGTGDCAGPKLLEYAYHNGLQPLAMGEFWYGLSPDTAVRTHGHFYPSCTSKCGPLLGYMMRGLEIQPDAKPISQSPIITYEDEHIVVVEKPSGMPSVPGLDGRLSLEEWLNKRASSSTSHDNLIRNEIEAQYDTESKNTAPQRTKSIIAVHRLDMDTSGVMVFAKTRNAEINLKKQFEEHSVRKTYFARLTSTAFSGYETTPPTSWTPSTLTRGIARFLHQDSLHRDSEQIDLPLSADYDERPRQKVDFKQGKPAHTEYEIIQNNPDGTVEVLLYPHTGRTHQLRVHCAHTLGLGCPIVGDLLYGAHTCLTPNNLHTSLNPEITHPATDLNASLNPEITHPDTDLNASLNPEIAHPDTDLNASLNPEIAHPDTSHSAVRLHLHALSITFRHPLTGSPLTFTSKDLCW